MNKAEAVKRIVSMKDEQEKRAQASKGLVMDLIKACKNGEKIDAGEAGVYKVVHPVTDDHLKRGVIVGQWGSSGLIKL